MAVPAAGRQERPGIPERRDGSEGDEFAAIFLKVQPIPDILFYPAACGYRISIWHYLFKVESN